MTMVMVLVLRVVVMVVVALAAAAMVSENEHKRATIAGKIRRVAIYDLCFAVARTNSAVDTGRNT